MRLSKDQLTKEDRKRLKSLRKLEKSLGKNPLPDHIPKISTDLDQHRATILCVRFGNKYGREYVERLRNMVSRNLDTDYEFACLTDDRHPIEGVRSIYQPAANYQKPWWHKIHMFDRDLPLAGKILYFDLDVVIHRDISKLINFPFQQMAGIRDFNRKFYPSWQYLNSSVMAWQHGQQHHIYESFKNDPNTAMRLQGDQDYIWKIMKNKITFWPESWIQSYKWEIRSRNDLSMIGGRRSFKSVFNGDPDPECSVTVFHGDPKPQDVMDRYVVENWR
jgi:hypothetical protein